MALRKKDEPGAKKFEGRLDSRNDGAPKLDGARTLLKDGGPLHVTLGHADGAPQGVRKPMKISTVSHTLDAEVAERLRHFAFRERISESAVIEYALRRLFVDGDDRDLGQQLRDSGAALRRRS